MVAAVFFIAFVTATSALAYDGYYWSGWNASPAGTPEQACQNFVNNSSATYQGYPLAEGPHGYNADQYVCYLYQTSQYDQWCTGIFITESRCIGDKEKGVGGTYTILLKQACPADPESTGNAALIEACGTEPSSCPNAGTPKRIATPINGTINNGVFVEDIPVGGMVIEIGGGLSADGCGYAIPIPDGNGVGGDVNPDTKVKCSPSGQCFRFSTYVATGQAREPGQDEATSVVIGDPESFVKEEDTNTDTRESRTSTTQTDPITENLDGKQITSQTVTTTETRGDGAVVETRDDITTVTQSDGITRTDTVTTTTTTNADGSKTVETTNNISYTQHPQTVYNIDNSTSRITVTAGSGASAQQTTRTVDTYDPAGNRTSSQTTEGPTTGDPAATEDPSEQGKTFCEENPDNISCKDYEGPSSEGEYSPDTELSYSSVMTDFTDRVGQSEFVGGVNGFFDLSVAGSCESGTVEFDGTVVVIDQHCSAMAVQIMGAAYWVIIAVASFAAFRVAVL
ncbi:hypothetical protein QKW35_06015 [Pontibacterium granulatum]|uniref:hypothetical protein n=1 Tax=Pontibacterium granulatum TaxID=2036029 RepID=UPI00249CDB21|nr:hypothetical protein [Pontibacterium granulatum]MDI3323924.1 hypothetical protein [Pontibacterium granulatum]